MIEDAPDPAGGALRGQTAVVTGASSGIGRAIADALAGRGAALVLHARANRAGLDETAQAARSRGVDVYCLMADLAEPESPETLVQAAWDWRPIDIWVHCAGADVLTGGATELGFDQKLDLLWLGDVRGTVLACRDVGRRMKRRGAGVILTTGWDQSETGMAGDSGEMFATVKGAVAAFTRSLAKSLAPEVRVNCVAPGWIHTKWAAGASEYWRERAKRESLVGRWGRPQDVAAMAAFLVSPEAAFVNGQVINVNGGFAGRAGESGEA